MNNREFDIKKYPKSKHNFQCLGPCYNPGTMAVHPTHLEIVSLAKYPFCPVDEWEYTNPKTKEVTTHMVDTCFNPIDITETANKELEINILTPYIDFNATHFLKIYYNIFSFEDSIDWIYRNKHVPIKTKLRIINSALNIFGKDIDLFDIRFTDFFIEYIKKKEIINIYNKIHTYISIDEKQNNVQIINPNNNSLNKRENCTERINFIIKTFLDKDDITKFLMRYFKYRKSNWNNFTDHILNMINDFIDYILNKINITL
jgi:hypothetical protein